MKNKWLLLTVSFLVGVLSGALAYAAVERDVQATVPRDSRLAESSGKNTDSNNNPFEEKVVSENIQPLVNDQGNDQWALVDETLYELSERVSVLEQRLAELNSPADKIQTVTGENESVSGGMDQQTLVTAGVNPETASTIMRRQSQVEMQRLELRDQASREGWIDSERFFEEMRSLNSDAGALREEIGEDAYDRFLYLTGQPNRVVISSVIDDSPAQQAGVRAGDVVLSYADDRILAWTDLRNATRDGNRGEDVLIRVLRNGQIVDLSMPRGPMGIRMDSELIDPDNPG